MKQGNFHFQEFMRILSKRNLKLIGLYVGVLLAAILCSPPVWSFIIAAQVASLPPTFYGLITGLRAFIFIAPLPWLLFLLAAPSMVAVTVRYKQFRFLPLWLAVTVIVWGGVPLAKNRTRFRDWRRAGLQRITLRAKPLIRAIDSHCAQEKQCPQYLEDLVPKYITQIPKTGAVAYPQFEYKPPGKSRYTSSYELFVRTPIGGINWDVFVYWPTQKYPREMYGGVTERIGDWAYVHE